MKPKDIVTESDVPSQAVLRSPDERLSLSFFQRKNDMGLSCLYYQVSYKNQPVILESRLEIQLDNHLSEMALGQKTERREHWCENLCVREIVQRSHTCDWRPVYGERSLVRDCYNEMTIFMAKTEIPESEMHLVIRAYDAGIAFRYYFPEDPRAVYYHITAENSEFMLPAGTKAYHTAWAQGPYTCLPLSDWPDESERPLTLVLDNGLYVCLAEAEMVDYARTNFKLSEDKPDTIVTSIYSPVDRITPFGTPWRVIMVAEQPGQLIENNDIIRNLNPPCEIADTSWIKPGKVIRDMTVSTSGAKACIDFAVSHNLQYVGIDWGWYGVERVFASDASKVNVDPRINPSRDFDIHEVIAYGDKHGIGVIVYVNQRALLKQLDEILPLYQSWGIKGIKFGFVQVGSHRWTVWMHEAVKKAANYNLLVDIHDEYRPTGFSRTYPNLMTQEGIHGNEEMPDATHNVTLPFTRFIAGAADYTISYYKQPGLGDFHGKMIQTTSAHQLALAVIYYSPLQFMFWYDRPGDYEGEPEIEFFEQVPTIWDETRVLHGRIGEYITIARRSGEHWFVGTITGNESRDIEIPLDFLEANRKYIARIYADNPSVDTRTHVGIEEKIIDAADTLNAKLLSSGGQAIWLRPV